MTNNQNIMILNGNDIGISKIELSNRELYIVDEIGKYSLCVHIYNWKEINSAEIGKDKILNLMNIVLVKTMNLL